MAKKTRTELSTLAINTNLPDNTTELITPTTERAQLTDERESVVNYKDDLGGTGNAGKFLTVATDGESLTMVDEPSGVPAWVTFVTTALANIMKLAAAGTTGNTQYSQINFLDSAATDILARIVSVQSSSATAGLNTLTIQTGTTDGTEGPSIFLSGEYYRNMILSSKNNTISLDTGGEFKVQINSVPQLTIASTGLATFSSGIQFGTGATLDKYEEGNWTSEFQNVTATYSGNTSTYTRIGNVVYFIVYIGTTTLDTTDTSQIQINLPFTAATGNRKHSPVTCFSENTWNIPNNGAGNIVPLVVPGTNNLDFYVLNSSTGANYTSATYTNLGTNAAVRVSGFYYV